MSAHDLARHPVHLGKGGTALVEPAFPANDQAMQWYQDYGARHAADGEEGRLVSCFRFSENWTAWEVHPAGAEVVVCLEGGMTLIQEIDGAEVRTRLGPGDYAINPPGIWHTADIDDPATALFITPGVGTQGRAR
jgi:uncharacterized cupin superfamily protein